MIKFIPRMAVKWIANFEYIFTDLRETHNQGVFDVYSPDMLRCRKSGVPPVTDGYGHGRIIGDRRLALYGISYLVRRTRTAVPDLSPRKRRRSRATLRLRESWRNIVGAVCGFKKWRNTV